MYNSQVYNSSYTNYSREHYLRYLYYKKKKESEIYKNRIKNNNLNINDLNKLRNRISNNILFKLNNSSKKMNTNANASTDKVNTDVNASTSKKVNINTLKSLNSNLINVYPNNKYIYYNSDENKYFDYINLKNFFYNFKTNKEITYNKYLNPKINLNFDKREKVVIINEWGYPPFGGGENWILDTCKVMNKKYQCFMLCFRNPKTNTDYKNYNIKYFDYVNIIQMKKDLVEILKLINYINPKLITHQGHGRVEYMRYANCLNIPFITGFCFWNDMIEFKDDTNFNMLKKDHELSNNYHSIINNSYSYCVSNFMNDILIKLGKKKLPVIESISNKDCYNNKYEFSKTRKYVSILNIHKDKGGSIVLELLKKLNKNIPLLLINTESHNKLLDDIKNAIKERNKTHNINIYYDSKVDNIKDIYNKTRIILTPSIVDETFCRVGYESMMNSIPVLSSKSGNLKYLLDGYADFLNKDNPQEWINKIESIYFNKKKLLTMSKRPKTINNPEDIYSKYMNFINNIETSKYTYNSKHIGIIVPWADQGLGIQGRELYISLEKLGFKPFVFSFKPYLSTKDNPLMQVNSEEWNYKNIIFSGNNREEITPEELIDFVYKYKISKILIPELCYDKIFNSVAFLKLCNIKVYGLVNIETTRISELSKHWLLDKILTNNNSSYKIMKNIFGDKTEYLNFGLSHPYFNDLKLKNINKDCFKFITFGGLNSLTRKNIKSTLSVFNYLEKKTKFLNWQLDVYIQGNELIDEKLVDTNRIKFHIGNMSYKEVIELYRQSDITIHIGDHEGLGLGFYESLSCYTPILSLNCYPNCEIIKDGINGWLINCKFENFTDNNEGIVKKGKINNNVYLQKVIQILHNKDQTISIIQNCDKYDNSDFLKRLKKILL